MRNSSLTASCSNWWCFKFLTWENDNITVSVASWIINGFFHLQKHWKSFIRQTESTTLKFIEFRTSSDAKHEIHLSVTFLKQPPIKIIYGPISNENLEFLEIMQLLPVYCFRGSILQIVLQISRQMSLKKPDESHSWCSLVSSLNSEPYQLTDLL